MTILKYNSQQQTKKITVWHQCTHTQIRGRKEGGKRRSNLT